MFWGLVVGIGIRTAFWLRCLRDAIGKGEDRKIWIEYYVFFISDLKMYCAKKAYFSPCPNLSNVELRCNAEKEALFGERI